MPRKKKTTTNETIRFRSAADTAILRINNGQNQNVFTIADVKIKECEWCFQFDEDEPYVFAKSTPNYSGNEAKISFTLSNAKHSNLVFKDGNGREFKLFCREKV